MTGAWVRGCLFIGKAAAGCVASLGVARPAPAVTASTTTPAAPAAMSPACQVMQVAYTTAVHSAVPAVPTDVAPYDDASSMRAFRLGEMVAPFRDRLGLQPAELTQLQARAAQYQQQTFVPQCSWQGTPTPYAPPDGPTMSVDFANPVFSADGRLAITQMSFFQPDGHARSFAFGIMCVARAGADGWTAVCQQSWVT